MLSSSGPGRGEGQGWPPAAPSPPPLTTAHRWQTISQKIRKVWRWPTQLPPLLGSHPFLGRPPGSRVMATRNLPRGTYSPGESLPPYRGTCTCLITTRSHAGPWDTQGRSAHLQRAGSFQEGPGTQEASTRIRWSPVATNATKPKKEGPGDISRPGGRPGPLWEGDLKDEKECCDTKDREQRISEAGTASAKALGLCVLLGQNGGIKKTGPSSPSTRRQVRGCSEQLPQSLGPEGNWDSQGQKGPTMK